MVDWQWFDFSQLSNAQLYEVLAVRQKVFVLEQQCIYPDIDDLDVNAHHLLGCKTIDGRRQLVAYLRCLGPGAKCAEVALGRVLTTTVCRGCGIGRQLVIQGIDFTERQYPGHHIRIGAQLYLEGFYAGFGFRSVSAPYDDDGIMHIDMLR